ncbi:MAG: hypothetical protein CVU03_09225 [Bacteroidetes bacterium HGW-Bacteroidetes-2]|nr:MAG: hypothetical protein CVU03_09225 [Bacteroidetes bacterium HGW-Bacteroidetes-2]
MAAFFKYLISVFLIFYLLAFGIQSISDIGLKKSYDKRYGDWNRLFGGKIHADIVLLGSSRVYVGYDPKIISTITGMPSYNLSFNAGAYNLQKMKWNAYLEHHKKPRMIVQNIDFSHLIASKKILYLEEFIPYLDQEVITKEIRTIYPEYAWIPYIPLLKYNAKPNLLQQGIRSFFGKEYHQSLTKDGFLAKDLLYKEDTHNLVSLTKMMANPQLRAILEDGLHYTNDLATNPEYKDIKIVFVWAPEKEERLQLLYPYICTIKEDLKTIAAASTNVYFLDFSEDTLSYSSAYFYDTFHFNTLGAETFSTKLAYSLKEILQ